MSAVGFVLALDMSGDWTYLSAVVVFRRPRFVVRPHVSSLGRRVRLKVLRDVLSFIDSNCYALCVRALVRRRVREFLIRKANRAGAWRSALLFEFSRIANHLRDRGFFPVSVVHADNEFLSFRGIIEDVFGAESVFIGKDEYILLADVVGYVNLRFSKLLKSYSNIVEL